MYQVYDGCGGSQNGPILFKDVFLFGEEGVPLQGNRVINRFVNFKNDQLLIWLREHKNRELVRLEGVVLPLYGDWSFNFWHWCSEMLPMALAAHEGGFSGTYLAPANPYAADSLRLLGIRPERIRVVEECDYYLDCMCLVRKANGHSASAMDLRRRIGDRFRAAFGRPGPRHNIYITRNTRPDATRKVVNEEELLSLLQRFDFTTLNFEDLSLSEQLSYTCNAKALLGPHGAGITHCAFMPEGSLVVELFAPTYITPCNNLPCRDLRHRYFQLTSFCNYDGYPHGFDILAHIPMIEMTLERELSAN